MTIDIGKGNRVNADEVLKEGQPVIMAKDGNRCGSVGVISEVLAGGFRVEWLLSPEGVPFSTSKSARYGTSALAPKVLDVLDDVPSVRRGFAFIYPLIGITDVKTMVEAHRADAEAQTKAVQTDFYMIGGVHGENTYYRNEQGTPKQPPLKKFLDRDEAIDVAAEMAAKYNQSFVVLGVTAVVAPKTVPEIKQDVVVTDISTHRQLENKSS